MKEMETASDFGLVLLVALLLCLLGAAILYGTWRGVKFLVDPSQDMWYAGTNRMLKNLIGTKGMRIYWYFLGGFVLMIGLVGVILGLGDLFVHLGIVPR